MSITVNDILNSKCGSRNQHLIEDKPKRKRIIKARNDCPEVQYIHWNLEKEYKFEKGRKFRFDFAIPELMIVVEYDWLNSEKSGHTTLVGFTKDTEKINLAISKGWRVLRFTILTYKQVLQEVEKNIKI